MPGRVVFRRIPGAAAGLVALALPLAGCGQSTSQRQAVAGYIGQVNRIQTQLVRPLTQVTKDGHDLGSRAAPGTGTGLLGGGLVVRGDEQRLLAAAGEIHGLRQKLAAIPAPSSAQHLRSLLLALVSGQEALTRQTAKLVIFVPQFAETLQPLTPAIRELEAALRVNQGSGPAAVAVVYQRKSAALRQFKTTVDGIITRMRPLAPPTVSAPEYNLQLHSLQGMSVTAGQLATVLAQGGGGNTSQLLRQFDLAVLSTHTRQAQQAQARAVKAYDARITRLNQLAEAASRERQRLANSLK